MTELINGRTPEEIKYVAEWNCYSCGGLECDDCSYLDACTVENRDRAVPDALALIEHLEAKVPRWVSVEERLPENDDLVLVRANGRARETRWDGAYVLAMYGSEGWVLWDYEDDEVHHLKVLQWMPLPEPPEVEHD